MSWIEISRNIGHEISHIFEVMAEAALPEPLIQLETQPPVKQPIESTPTLN